jgi:hypothetical protein
MRPTLSSFSRWMVVAAAAGLVVAVQLAVPSVPAQAAVGALSRGNSPEARNGDSQNPTLAHDPTTVTTTCGNGPIIVLPFTITTIHCEGDAEASGRHARASLS